MQTQKTSPDYSSEDRCRAEGYAVVCGVDEAGAARCADLSAPRR